MSDFRAIATVTETLRLVLDAPVNKINSGANAFTVRPEDVPKGGRV